MKCSKHSGKEAAAMCDRCNLFYCGDCVLSAGGKCPACGNTLRSPQTVLPFEINPEELYKGKGQPALWEVISAFYMEPARMMRRLDEYASFLIGVINASLLYFILMIPSICLTFLSILAAGSMQARGQVFFIFLVSFLIGYSFWLIAWLSASLLLYIPARLLGGKGTFMQHTYMLSYIFVAVFPPFLIAVVLFILSIFASVLHSMSDITLWGILASFLLGVLTLLYSLFLTYLSIREVDKLKNMRALVSLIISVVIALLGVFLYSIFGPSSFRDMLSMLLL